VEAVTVNHRVTDGEFSILITVSWAIAIDSFECAVIA